MLDEHTLHCAHLQSNKKQLWGHMHFHYACLVPYSWQYRYVTTVLPVFARNVFYSGCSVLIWLSLIFTPCSAYKYNKRNSYNFWTYANLQMKPNAEKSENWIFSILCSINLNIASISDTGNAQPIIILDPYVMLNLWWDIVDNIINYFLEICQITYCCAVDLVLNKPTQEKIGWC